MSGPGNAVPAIPTAGKRRSGRQTDYFAAVAVERHWLDYSARFRAQSNFMAVPLPPESIDPRAPAGAAGFARCYGFREKPERIRFRVLDPAHALLPAAGEAAPEQDVTLDAASFAALDAGVSRLFITENEINFLAFPRVRGAW